MDAWKRVRASTKSLWDDPFSVASDEVCLIISPNVLRDRSFPDKRSATEVVSGDSSSRQNSRFSSSYVPMKVGNPLSCFGGRSSHSILSSRVSRINSLIVVMYLEESLMSLESIWGLAQQCKIDRCRPADRPGRTAHFASQSRAIWIQSPSRETIRGAARLEEHLVPKGLDPFVAGDWKRSGCLRRILSGNVGLAVNLTPLGLAKKESTHPARKQGACLRTT